jgi:non-specific serine/threonine protein kinase
MKPVNVEDFRRLGRFRLDLHRRELLAGGVAVNIGSRALDILIVLIEARGELVTKDELMSRVWPGSGRGERPQAQISAISRRPISDRSMRVIPQASS